MACGEAGRDKDALIQMQTDMLTQQQSDIQRLQEERASPLNSKPLWFVVGMVVTGATVFLVK